MFLFLAVIQSYFSFGKVMQAKQIWEKNVEKKENTSIFTLKETIQIFTFL